MSPVLSSTGGERPAGLSSTAARYLEATYYIAHEGETVRPSHIAEWLGVSAPTVTGVMQRLHEQGLVEFNADRSLRLTPVGEQRASEVVRRHRVVERWLTDALGLDWATADLEAGRMSHFFSDVVLERIFEALGRPTTCPHGNEIPGAGMRDRQLVSLFELEQGVAAVISRISEVAEHEAPQLLRLLEVDGLRPGVQVEVRREPGAEALTVVVAGRQTALGLRAARSVWVERARTRPLPGSAESA
ncbi:MAG TPA: metal-dependent transcriptional regulator [Candidatus Dormibacteraeota bacterium]|nr:metal-dependent transcriptional regulator [Candidatus Dormibacteraeota bacterium]